jgi:hypothetical protein
MINAREKLPDITFQYPASFGVVFACLIGEKTKSINRFMRSLFQPARE